MLGTSERLQKILAANAKQLAAIDGILRGETTEKHEVNLETCTYSEAARRLRLSRPTVYRLVRDGRLRTVALCGVRRVTFSSMLDFVNGK